jgi:DNA-binding response OmpR family regulator
VIVADDVEHAVPLAQALVAGGLRALEVTLRTPVALDAIRAIRADPALADLPVILLTARAQESDVETGFDSGADDYITKPFSPRELASRVEALLSRSG